MRTVAGWLGAVAALLVLASPSDAARFRIVTFNAEILQAPYVRASRLSRFRWATARRRHLERVAAIIETLHPHVFNLVEVTSVEAVDELVEILHEKGHRDYAGYHVESHDGFTGMDVALISRIEPDEVEGRRIRTFFSRDDISPWRDTFTYKNDEGELRNGTTSLQRHSLYYVRLGGRKFGFLGLHLKSNPDDAYANAKRSAESRIAQRIIRREIVARGYEPIVLGDLNDYDPDVPDRDESRSTKTSVLANLKDFDPEREGPELFNVAEGVVRRQDRYTSHWDRNENGAVDPGDVFTMLDHILLPRELRPHVRRAFISHVTGLDVSDHRPVVVDVELPFADSGAAPQ